MLEGPTIPAWPCLDDVDIVRGRAVHGSDTCSRSASCCLAHNAHSLLPTAVCRPKINTHDEPILGGGTALRCAVYTSRNAAIGPWIERIGSVVPSIQERGIHGPGFRNSSVVTWVQTRG
jgi:hypothetical protein